MNLIKSQEGYTGGFRGRKIKGEMQLCQNLKKKNLKIKDWTFSKCSHMCFIILVWFSLAQNNLLMDEL